MKRVLERLHLLAMFMLPLGFVGTNFLNMIAFVLCLHEKDLYRQLFVYGIQGIAIIVFICRLASIWRGNKNAHKLILLTALIPFLFAIISLIALFISEDKVTLFINGVVSGAYLVSACAATLIIALDQKLERFLAIAKGYCVVIIPIVGFYCVRFYLPSAEYGVENLGIVDYMTLAYTLLDLNIFLMADTLLYGEKKYSRIVNLLLFTLFSIAITLSGTKGAMVCLAVAVCILVGIALIIKRYQRFLLSFCIIALAVVLLFTTILYPNYGVENRFVAMIKEFIGITEVDISQENIGDTTDIMENIPTESPTTESEKLEAIQFTDIVEFVKSGEAEQALNEGNITQTEYEALVAMSISLNKTATGARKYLWTCALYEIQTAPLFGQGLFFYQTKYGTYPHNLFLEISTDFGILAAVLFLALGLFVFIKLTAVMKGNVEVSVFVLYVCAHLFQRMVSGSLYSYSVFFEYGFCVIIVLLLARKKQGEETVVETEE